MAALAYLLLPLSGLIAFLAGSSPRLRFHGLQAIAIGTLWPAALYAAALGPASVVQAVFALGVTAWLVLLSSAALGKDLRLPGLGRFLEEAAGFSRGEPRNTSGTTPRSTR